MRQILVAMLALALGAGAADAQSRLSGRVLELYSERPLGCVNVQLLDGADQMRAETKTGRDGGFEFLVPDSSLYRLRIYAVRLTDELTEPDRAPAATAFTREYRVPLYVDTASWADDTTSFVHPIPGGPGPRFPTEMRNRGISGNTLLTFVVQPSGGVDTTSAFVLAASRVEFALAVLDAIPRLRFRPFAETPSMNCSRVVAPFFFQVSR